MKTKKTTIINTVILNSNPAESFIKLMEFLV